MRICALFSRCLMLLLAASLCVVSADATTIAIDGYNDFTPADTYATSTPGFTGYATHDGVNLYLGFDGPGLSAAPTTTWLVAYLGTGAPGTTSGLLFNTQQPNLAFSASHAFRRRLDMATQDVQMWNGASWVTAPIGSAVALIPPGDYIELSLSLSALGSPSTLQVAAYLLDEQLFFETSYAALPGNAFVDGYDPNVSSYITFNIVPEPSTAPLAGVGFAMVGAKRRRR